MKRRAQANAAATGASFYACDLTDIPATRAVVAQIEAEHGAVSVLVNNCWQGRRHAMEDVEPVYWRRALAMNLDHQFFVTSGGNEGHDSEWRRLHHHVQLHFLDAWPPGHGGLHHLESRHQCLTKTLARELGPSALRQLHRAGAIVTERQLKLWTSPEQTSKFIDLQALKFRLDASHVARLALSSALTKSNGCTVQISSSMPV